MRVLCIPPVMNCINNSDDSDEHYGNIEMLMMLCECTILKYLCILMVAYIWSQYHIHVHCS